MLFYPHRLLQRHEGRRMQTTAPDRDDVKPEAVRPEPPHNDVGFPDAFALWQDLGGSD